MVARMGNLSALKDFISFLSTVRGDISHITAPPFILAPSSLIEFPSYLAERPALFVASAHEDTPERRLLCVLKHYLSCLQRQYYVGRTVKEGLKKPLNPFLGELFFCEYTQLDLDDEKSSAASVRVISEQVSHHPPTTACYLSSDAHGVHAEAYSTQVTTLSGTSVLIRQSGHAVVTIDKFNERYLIPLPDVTARGVITGMPWPELNDTYKIIASSGFTAEIRFIGKGFWGGERNCFEASIYKTNDSSATPIFTLRGSWSSRFQIFDAEGNEMDSFDLADPQNQPAPMIIRPIQEQDPWESRNAWGPTFDAIRKVNHSAVVEQKSKLETAQRHMRKKEHTEGRKWESIFFEKRHDTKSDMVEDLLEQLSPNEAHRMRGKNGCWRFSKEKEQRWKIGQGPFRPKTPFG
ncbi:hypothetical protein B0A52_08228 [Exophiala mesophila]|uniref:Oxysterol-binding protein n=1 Tax=Exophiala mesophila TaxID=212818 RepID=A0A438MYN9_EXOME|nr:hypothetical protein B0A52_08228 [Exophiala mesophila]